MIPGEEYVCERGGAPARKVTMLETPIELRRRARVLVRFDEGILLGEVHDVPSVSITQPWKSPTSGPPLPTPYVDTDRSPTEEPVGQVEGLLVNVVFTDSAVKQCREAFRLSGSNAQLYEQLRDEVRRRAYLEQLAEKPNEFGRLRVRGRFDIVLRTEPSVEDPAVIERLALPRRRRRTTSPSSRSRGVRAP
jgi:hypothetical protein